tara:strand:+ start:1821 stop:2075 length:255 start_codon:yes stop_codon:yes gene_type:complete
MKYQVKFTNQAKRFLKKLDRKERSRILDKFEELREDPFRYLEHYEGEGYKFRIGAIRSIIDAYQDKKILSVRIIDKRGRIYKKK